MVLIYCIPIPNQNVLLCSEGLTEQYRRGWKIREKRKEKEKEKEYSHRNITLRLAHWISFNASGPAAIPDLLSHDLKEPLDVLEPLRMPTRPSSRRRVSAISAATRALTLRAACVNLLPVPSASPSTVLPSRLLADLLAVSTSVVILSVNDRRCGPSESSSCELWTWGRLLGLGCGSESEARAVGLLVNVFDEAEDVGIVFGVLGDVMIGAVDDGLLLSEIGAHELELSLQVLAVVFEGGKSVDRVSEAHGALSESKASACKYLLGFRTSERK